MTIVIIISTILLSLILSIVIALLITPIQYNAFFNVHKEISTINIKVSWLFGILAFKYTKISRQRQKYNMIILGKEFNVNNTHEEEKKRKKRKKKWNGKRKYTKQFIHSIIKSVKKTITHIMPRKLQADFQVGFYDPSYTGVLYAIKSIFIGHKLNKNINIRCSWEISMLEGQCFAEGHLILGFIAYEALKSVLIYVKQKHTINKNKI